MAIHVSSCILTCVKPIAASCRPRAYQRQTSARSRTVLSASHENSSLIGRKEEKPDARWRLSASNNQRFQSTETGARPGKWAGRIPCLKSVFWGSEFRYPLPGGSDEPGIL